MKKKVLSALLAAVVALSLAACATQTETPAATTAATTAETTIPPQTEPEYAVGTIAVGTTAAIETAVYGEYNFDMLASGVSELRMFYHDLDLYRPGGHDLVRWRSCDRGGYSLYVGI